MTGIDPPPPPASNPPPSTLRVLCLGGDDLTAALGDGSPLRASIIDRRGSAPDIEIRRGPEGPLAAVLDQLSDGSELLSDTHIVLRSVLPDIDVARPPAALGASLRPLLERFAVTTKAPDRTVIVIGVSTYDPAGAPVDLRTVISTPSLAAHQMNIELINVSMFEGVSLVDVDRIVAEHGGKRCVTQPFVYTAELAASIVDELAAILDDSGWFDDRPILAQRGRRAEVTG